MSGKIWVVEWKTIRARKWNPGPVAFRTLKRAKAYMGACHAQHGGSFDHRIVAYYRAVP